jgi:hypothetical protein
MLCKEDLVGDWFVTGDAFRFAPPPGQGLSLFTSSGQHQPSGRRQFLSVPLRTVPAVSSVPPSSSPARHGVKRADPPPFSSGKKITKPVVKDKSGESLTLTSSVKRPHLREDSMYSSSGDPPRLSDGEDWAPPKKRLPSSGTPQVKRCKHCGKARAPTDRFRREGGLLCPDFAKTQRQNPFPRLSSAPTHTLPAPPLGLERPRDGVVV